MNLRTILILALFVFANASSLFSDCSQGILFPFYLDPTESNLQPLIDAKHTYPHLSLSVILNPDSGVGKKRSTEYVAAIKNLQKAGISVLGYIATNYANRSITSVEHEIKTWKKWYHPDGLFFDEMSVSHQYYQTLTTYAKLLGFEYTVGNPGDNISIASAHDVDMLVVYENGFLPNLDDFKNWEVFPPCKIAMLSYDISVYPSAFVAATSPVFGWIFLTDDHLSNPWDSYPSYFSQLVDQLGTQN